MHELAIAEQVVAIAEAGGRGARVRRVVVRVGRLAAVMPDALRFCFDAAAADTLVEGARLDIVETPGRARCRVCENELELADAWGSCTCGALDLEWLAGTELEVQELEVE
jgi:hydrogenase nickel incorporation protein HypA/HybF